MATVVRERTRPPSPAEANGCAPEPDHFTDPAMTRVARQARAAWRRAAPEAWHLELRDLYHYTADYPYDPDHEYAWDWTTDPDYGTDSVRLFRFDADGVMDVPDRRATSIQLAGFDTTDDRLGSRVEYETAVHYTAAGGVVRRAHPDLMVLPRADMLGMATGRDRALRLDRGQPPPDLALEILSFGGMQRDLEDKLRLYARLGIREYLVYDLGGKRRRGSPRGLLLFRLENGAYRRAEPEPKEADTDPEEYWSEVFGTYIRMMPDPREAFSDKPAELRPPPRFQWWDPEQGRWRDTKTDAEVERQAERDRHAREVQESRTEGRTEGRLVATIDIMRTFLGPELAVEELEQIEAAWRRDGLPAEALQRVQNVLQTPNEWRALLLPEDPNDDNGPDHFLPPSEPRPA